MEKGKTLEKLGRYQQAIDCYTITLGLDDPTSFALLRIGKCHERLGHLDKALQFYNKCVEEDALLDKGWIAITDFYFRQKDYKKALYYIDKAINIDSENVLYWKRYAKINNRLHLFEEAEHGYRRALELGNYEQDTWLVRCDILLQLGENQAAVNNLFQAAEFYPESPEIEFRLAGLFFTLNEPCKAEFHLKNGLDLDPDFTIVIEELFPKVYDRDQVQQIIRSHQKPSL